LSKLHVAQMPWDPIPQPPSSSVKAENREPIQSGNGGHVKVEGGYEPHIKQEVKYENDALRFPGQNVPTGYAMNPLAGQRAAQHLAQQYGDKAAQSIMAAGLPPQPRPMSLPGQVQQRPPMLQQMPNQNHRPPQPNQYNQNRLGNSQVDGADEEPTPLLSMQERWDAFVIETRNTTAEQNAEADGFLRQQLREEEMVEANQIMMTESERKKLKRRMRQVKSKPGQASSSSAQAPSLAQVDGGDDDEEDEDAINSDLDDSEDEAPVGDDDDEGHQGETILCTWDKVNRVKNKVNFRYLFYPLKLNTKRSSGDVL
jgi:transcription initiation factor TFIIA large subunit